MSGTKGSGQAPSAAQPQSVPKQQNSTQKTPDPPSNNQGGNASQGPEPIIASQPNPPCPNNKKTTPNHQKKHPLEYLIFFFVVIGAIATGFAAYFSYHQWKVAEDAEKRQLRAYVFERPIRVMRFEAGAKPIGVVANRNSGQTPAYHVRAISGIAIARFPLEDNEIPSIAPDKSPETVLNPTNEYDVGENKEFDQEIRPADVDAVRDGKIDRIYVYGTVFYQDAFGTEHYSNFCFGLYGQGKELTTWEYCPTHNDAD
jgi:hypothetical protein